MPTVDGESLDKALSSIQANEYTAVLFYASWCPFSSIAGFEPIQLVVNNRPSSLGLGRPKSHPWDGSPNEILSREPYLVFSLLFFCLKVLLYFFPGMLSRIKAFWISYGWHLNLGIFGETSQLLERVLHVANVKRAWSKFGLTKTRNFHNGAKNARVWASLASVSLGESSARTTDS
ncbi:hypothetical protein ACLOJK_028719 [Asimina triloba]